jgi:hypothetical protein
MEESRLGAIQHCLFAWWICKAENTMTVIFVSKPFTTYGNMEGETHSGSLLGAHTIATLSGNIT